VAKQIHGHLWNPPATTGHDKKYLDDDQSIHDNGVARARVSCDGRYVVYLFWGAGSGRKYNGQTVKLNERLRQHHGEIAGGAQPPASDWRPIALVDGFGTDRHGWTKRRKAAMTRCARSSSKT